MAVTASRRSAKSSRKYYSSLIDVNDLVRRLRSDYTTLALSAKNSDSAAQEIVGICEDIVIPISVTMAGIANMCYATHGPGLKAVHHFEDSLVKFYPEPYSPPSNTVEKTVRNIYRGMRARQSRMLLDNDVSVPLVNTFDER